MIQRSTISLSEGRLHLPTPIGTRGLFEAARGVTEPMREGGERHRDQRIFTPACQHLPGFQIIPRETPKERKGLWFVIDF